MSKRYGETEVDWCVFNKMIIATYIAIRWERIVTQVDNYVCLLSPFVISKQCTWCISVVFVRHSAEHSLEHPQ